MAGPQRLTSTFLEKVRVEGYRRGPGVKKKFQKMLILVFDLIVQPPKHTFEIGFFSLFSSLWSGQKYHVIIRRLVLQMLSDDASIIVFDRLQNKK